MYKKLILSTALGLVMFAGDSLAEKTGSCGSTCTYTMDDAGNVVITGTGALGTLQGVNKADITSVAIPNGITSIGFDVFAGSQLTSVNIPSSVINIETNAFRSTKLTNVTIPSSVQTIGQYAFYGNPLTKVELQGTPELNVNSFSGKPQVTYPEKLIWSCGSNCSGTLDKNGHVEFKGTGSLGGLVQAFGDSVTSVTIPDGITKIEGYAFIDSTLTSVTIPDSVTSIGGYAFARMPYLTSINIPDSVTTIEGFAFAQTKLTSVTIPDSVTSIGNYAFYNIPTLTSLILPDSVTSIGLSAFGVNGSLQEIFCSKASVESGKCASMASAGGAREAAKIGYYKDDAMNDERVFYLKDANGIWQEAKRESIYEKYVADTGAVYLYDSKGNLKKMKGKKIYTLEEAEEATKNGNRFHVGLTYK